MANCEKKPIVIYQGFGTKWNNVNLLTITFATQMILDGFEAEFQIGEITKTFTDIEEGFSINLTAQETATLPIGPNAGTLILVDREHNRKPFSTELPFLVKDWEDGDIKLDGFLINIDSRIQDNELIINIETMSLDKTIENYVNDRIHEHDTSETAHEYIRGLISSEAETRERVDGELQQQINEISVLANGYVHEQGTASSTWEIEHNLGKYPSVTVVDSANNEIIAGIQYVDKNNVIVTMNGASKGKAYLN